MKVIDRIVIDVISDEKHVKLTITNPERCAEVLRKTNGGSADAMFIEDVESFAQDLLQGNEDAHHLEVDPDNVVKVLKPEALAGASAPKGTTGGGEPQQQQGQQQQGQQRQGI